MASLIQNSSITSPEVFEISRSEVKNTAIFQVVWQPASTRVWIVGCKGKTNGFLAPALIKHATIEVLTPRPGVKAPVKTISFGNYYGTKSANCFGMGDFTGKFSVWDTEREEEFYAAQAPEMIYCVNNSNDLEPFEWCASSQKGAVTVWDLRSSEPVVKLQPDNSMDCWSAVLCDKGPLERCIICGYDNGDLKVYDMRNNKIRWELNVGDGICSIDIDKRDYTTKNY